MRESEEFTYLQKTSFVGELAYIIFIAPHDADLKFHLYILFKEVPRECLPLAIQTAKELTKLDENEIDKIALEAANKQVPVWLWIERALSDMKEYLNLDERSPSGVSTEIKRRLCREKLVESSFITFARMCLCEFPECTKKLCEEILQNPSLSFLEQACFYIMNTCDEALTDQGGPDKITHNLLRHRFDIQGIMSYSAETSALHFLNKAKTKKRSAKSKKKYNSDYTLEDVNDLINRETDLRELNSFEINDAENPVMVSQYSIKIPEGIDAEKTPKEFSEFINKKITEVFSKINKKGGSTETKYLVKKAYLNPKYHDELLKECATEEEAYQFVKKLETTFPELQKTCKFLVVKEEDRKGRE